MTHINEAMTSPTDEIVWSLLDFDDMILKVWLREGVTQSLEVHQQKAPDHVVDLATRRVAAKENKDYDTADTLRKEITIAWWRVKDIPWGFDLEKL